jgi:hypothetical protein
MHLNNEEEQACELLAERCRLSPMIPMGYMAKRNLQPPSALGLAGVIDIYSVNDCVNDNFADYVDYWKHNGYWFFDSPEIICQLAQENSIDLKGTKLFYYEVHELEFDGQTWRPFTPWTDLPMNVRKPGAKYLEGFDVITVWAENSPCPEHSPLSCNGIAKELRTNFRCLFETFEEAEGSISRGGFANCEPEKLRIVAVFSLDWPVKP